MQLKWDIASRIEVFIHRHRRRNGFGFTYEHQLDWVSCIRMRFACFARMCEQLVKPDINFCNLRKVVHPRHIRLKVRVFPALGFLVLKVLDGDTPGIDVVEQAKFGDDVDADRQFDSLLSSLRCFADEFKCRA